MARLSARSALRRGPLGLLIGALVFSLAVATPAAASGPLIDTERPAPPTRGGEHGHAAAERPASLPTGRLIVTYRTGTTDRARGVARTTAAVSRVANVALPDHELVAPRGDLERALRALKARPEVASVEREYRRVLYGDPTAEPLSNQQWSLNNSGQTVNGYAGVADVDMNVFEAWQVTTGSPDIVVAVIDDGVDFSHPDLAGQQWVNASEIAGNGIDDDNNGLIDDVNGWDFCHNDSTLHDAADFHGTHVAGSIAAQANGVGMAGVAPNVKIMAIKFIEKDNPDCGTDTEAIDAINYAAAHGAQVINASWGGPDLSNALGEAIANASHTLIVAAAGNDGQDLGVFPVYPAALGPVLSVASVHNEGFLAGTSNYGPGIVDLAAPGNDILSTLPDGQYGLLSGTSMAAANTSGVVALALSAHPTLARDPRALKTHMIRTARALPTTLGLLENPRLVDARAAVITLPDIQRLSGADRYATSAAISAATFVPHVPYVFVATGTSFPDALAGGALAGQAASPLLLVKPTSIPTPTLNEIKRLKPIEIFVLGGPGAVSDGVLAQLSAYDDANDGGTYRLAGADRYATAAAISRAAWQTTSQYVVIANGANFPDALSGAPAAAHFGAPVLLSMTTSVPAVTLNELKRLNPGQVIIAGGTGVVSDQARNQIQNVLPTATFLRWSGADRYATAAAITSNGFPAPGAAVFLASGQTFPDALPAAPIAAAYDGPLLLTQAATLPAATKEALLAYGANRIFVLGGTGVISDGVVTQIRGLFP